MSATPAVRGFAPFDYQAEGFRRFREWFGDPRADREALVALATGLGKTFTAGLCLESVLSGGGSVLWLANRHHLISQAAEEIGRICGRDVEIEQAGRRARPGSRLVVASVPTLRAARLASLARDFRPSLVICDEAHHGDARTWLDVKAAFWGSRILNLTATPYRGDVSGRMDLGAVLVERSTSDGIRMGRLVPPRAVGTLRADLTGVGTRGGDYETGSLSRALCRPDLVSRVASEVLAHLPGRRCILFAASVPHGRLLASALRGAGAPVWEVYGTTPLEERRDAYDAVRGRAGGVLLCNLVLVEGFDLPPLDLVAIARPTKNAALFLQMLGRGLRSCPSTGKRDCLLIDVIDARKRPGGAGEVEIPTTLDLRRAEAMHGRVLSGAGLFLRWFSPAGWPAGAAPAGFPEPEDLWAALYPDGALRAMPGAAVALEGLRAAYAPEGIEASSRRESAGYAELFRALGVRTARQVMRLLRDAGYRYHPGGRPAPEPGAGAGEGDGGADWVGESVEFSDVLASDAALRNFVLDLLRSPDRPDSRYFERVHVGGIDPSGSRELNFYRPWRGETPHVLRYLGFRSADGRRVLVAYDLRERPWVFRVGFDSGKLKLDVGRPAAELWAEIPDHLKREDWLALPATRRQLAEAAEILGMRGDEVAAMGLCRIAASAILSGAYDRRALRVVNGILGGRRGRRPPGEGTGKAPAGAPRKGPSASSPSAPCAPG